MFDILASILLFNYMNWSPSPKNVQEGMQGFNGYLLYKKDFNMLLVPSNSDYIFFVWKIILDTQYTATTTPREKEKRIESDMVDVIGK